MPPLFSAPKPPRVSLSPLSPKKYYDSLRRWGRIPASVTFETFGPVSLGGLPESARSRFLPTDPGQLQAWNDRWAAWKRFLDNPQAGPRELGLSPQLYNEFSVLRRFQQEDPHRGQWPLRFNLQPEESRYLQEALGWDSDELASRMLAFGLDPANPYYWQSALDRLAQLKDGEHPRQQVMRRLLDLSLARAATSVGEDRERQLRALGIDPSWRPEDLTRLKETLWNQPLTPEQRWQRAAAMRWLSPQTSSREVPWWAFWVPEQVTSSLSELEGPAQIQERYEGFQVPWRSLRTLSSGGELPWEMGARIAEQARQAWLRGQYPAPASRAAPSVRPTSPNTPPPFRFLPPSMTHEVARQFGLISEKVRPEHWFARYRGVIPEEELRKFLPEDPQERLRYETAMRYADWYRQDPQSRQQPSLSPEEAAIWYETAQVWPELESRATQHPRLFSPVAYPDRGRAPEAAALMQVMGLDPSMEDFWKRLDLLGMRDRWSNAPMVIDKERNLTVPTSLYQAAMSLAGYAPQRVGFTDAGNLFRDLFNLRGMEQGSLIPAPSSSALLNTGNRAWRNIADAVVREWYEPRQVSWVDPHRLQEVFHPSYVERPSLANLYHWYRTPRGFDLGAALGSFGRSFSPKSPFGVTPTASSGMTWRAAEILKRHFPHLYIPEYEELAGDMQSYRHEMLSPKSKDVGQSILDFALLPYYAFPALAMEMSSDWGNQARGQALRDSLDAFHSSGSDTYWRTDPRAYLDPEYRKLLNTGAYDRSLWQNMTGGDYAAAIQYSKVLNDIGIPLVLDVLASRGLVSVLGSLPWAQRLGALGGQLARATTQRLPWAIRKPVELGVPLAATTAAHAAVSQIPVPGERTEPMVAGPAQAVNSVQNLVATWGPNVAQWPAEAVQELMDAVGQARKVPPNPFIDPYSRKLYREQQRGATQYLEDLTRDLPPEALSSEMQEAWRQIQGGAQGTPGVGGDELASASTGQEMAMPPDTSGVGAVEPFPSWPEGLPDNPSDLLRFLQNDPMAGQMMQDPGVREAVQRMVVSHLADPAVQNQLLDKIWSFWPEFSPESPPPLPASSEEVRLEAESLVSSLGISPHLADLVAYGSHARIFDKDYGFIPVWQWHPETVKGVLGMLDRWMGDFGRLPEDAKMAGIELLRGTHPQEVPPELQEAWGRAATLFQQQFKSFVRERVAGLLSDEEVDRMLDLDPRQLIGVLEGSPQKMVQAMNDPFVEQYVRSTCTLGLKLYQDFPDVQHLIADLEQRARNLNYGWGASGDAPTPDQLHAASGLSPWIKLLLFAGGGGLLMGLIGRGEVLPMLLGTLLGGLLGTFLVPEVRDQLLSLFSEPQQVAP